MKAKNTVCVMVTRGSSPVTIDAFKLYHKADTRGNSIRPLDWRDSLIAQAVGFVAACAVFVACAVAFCR